jgi:2-polyprenyl-3-methyl-5-hydroxy-6-metoxy-1,4-benzoquinol methylase
MIQEQCKICGEKKYIKIDFNNIYLRTDSGNKNFHNFSQRVCYNCGVVYQFPQIDKEKSTLYYETNSRNTKHPIFLDNEERFDFPIQFEQTGISFQRFFHFYKIIKKYSEIYPDLIMDSKKTILDYGAYQGAFLYACKKKFGVRTVAYDYNEKGLEHAKNFLGIDSIVKSIEISKDVFEEKIDLCSALQVIEHLYNPLNFLKHVKNNILKKSGYIYVEVPSALTSEYSNPVHLFMFTKKSLSNLFSMAGYKIIHIAEEKIYNYKNLYPFKRHVQTMIHCLAIVSNNDEEYSKSKFLIGKETYNLIKKSHFENSNKIFFIKLKRNLKELLILIYYSLFVLLAFLSNKISFNLFKKINLLLKKIPKIKDLGRK